MEIFVFHDSDFIENIQITSKFCLSGDILIE